ncbi:MAG: T9SS type A sorting domain-containing protein [Fimbriimonadaceae bacterium]|nr:T9SS type A sorting domain-containing protein [Chitinophagales bacterium]
MKKGLLILLVSNFFTLHIFAGPGDTIAIQTFTFGSPQDAWFVFPSADTEIERVLMQYTLRCIDGGAGGLSYECGEWDYLTYTYLYEHTGNYDSTLLYHPNYLANGVSPDTFQYVIAPTYTILPNWNYYIVYDDTTSYNEYQIGDETSFYAHPFTSSNPIARTQILWKSDELITAGLSAGNLTGLQFELGDIGSSLNNLKIKLKHSTLTELNEANYETAGFTEVFYNDITFTASGWFGFDFTTPFNWDGISNLIMEITFDNSVSGIYTSASGTITDFNSVMHTNSNDKYISFTQPNYANTIDNALADLTDVVTISFWAFGNADLQPQDGTCFEAITESGQRVLNSHTPWSNQNIYWDAGNDGGYDRIEKTASPDDYENTWTHWAFTKNATTGNMYIYKNGVLFHSGTGKTKWMEDIVTLWLGKGTWGGSPSYEGWMDEFTIWNAELDATTIQNYLYKDIDDAHPFADNLLLYYHFNDGAGIYETDYSASDVDLAKIGATTHLLNAEDQFRNLQFVNLRPNVKFEQGIFTSHIDSVLVLDSIPNDPITLITFYPDEPTVGIDTILVYPGNYYNYIYDAAGNIIDSNFVATTNTIYNEEYTYYSQPFEVINRYEIARYITPYGIGLDLGEGFTWTYDVTDYLPLLNDSVHLSAGNWQEELDLKFIFIEGTPARKPTSVTNLWSGGFGYGLTPSYDEQTPDKTISIPADAENTRIKVRVTGHGFGGTSNCAEFCKKDHYIFVDGVSQWTREVWRETCDLNPVYPQGGTWVYDRANWCPGAEVETYDFELTPFVTPGNDVALDYDAESYTWNGSGSVPYYQTEVQLITYDTPNFNLDAAMEDIIAPSDNNMWSRKNPICNNPIIKIKNKGTSALTSLEIEFGIKGFEKAYYNWTGNLNFLETEEIALPDFPWTNSATEFEVTISNPNGSSDEYSYNNYMKSKMEIPPVYVSDFVVEMRTNNKPNENDLFIYDASGNTVLERTSFEENTIYKDTLHLADGCYEIYLEDAGEDGLDWWANTDGEGYFKLKNIDPPSTIKTFNADFGGLIYHQFIVGNYVDIENELQENITLKVLPNPARDKCYINYSVTNSEEAVIQIFDIAGRKLFEENELKSEGIIQIDLSQLASGIYLGVISNGTENKTEKFVVNK